MRGCAFKLKSLPFKSLVALLSALVLSVQSLTAEEIPGPASCCDTIPLSAGINTIHLRWRFIVPGSFRLICGGTQVPDSLYRLEPVPGVIHLDHPLSCTEAVACYQAWNFLSFPDSFRLRQSFEDSIPPSGEQPDTLRGEKIDSLRYREEQLRTSTVGEGFRLAGFDIQGSKSVSVSGGGTGSATAFDQNLMLQITGKLSPDTRLAFRLNDQDLPLASDGRSAELRELDEISVTLSSPLASVSLGDYDFKLGGFSFANIERKLDGVSGRLKQGPFTVGASAALSGGTFHSLRFTGTEGRQGPYQLVGKNGEPVRVLAGTERIYLDGVLLKRGVRNDYIIDYNQGTIYFADRHLIGSESRIETDYEYSRFTFKKTLYSVTGRAESRIGVFRGYFLRESDLESSPLGGQFTPEEQEYLSQIGAGLDSLLYSGVRYVGEGNGTYRLRFDSQDKPYFEYTGQGNGDYFVSFMEAGSLRGSYTFDPTTGAYRYVGANLGDFEPAGEVTAPGREDRIGVDFELNPLRHLRLAGEGALLKRTLNLFSGQSRPISTAHKLYFHLDTLGVAAFPGKVSLWGGESTVEDGFSFQGRRYEADFERRWHLDPLPQGEKESDHGEKLRETGTMLHLPAGLELGAGYGELSRTNGERSERRDYSLNFLPLKNFMGAWRRLNIHSRRLSPDSIPGGELRPSFRSRDNAEARFRWGILTPQLLFEREERTAPSYGGEINGKRHLELIHRLGATFSPRFQTDFSFSSRETEDLVSGSIPASLSRWEPESRSQAAQIDFRYQGRGALRVKGRLGHRSYRYEKADINRTSSTAGRIEVFGGGFAGAFQSHVVYDISHGSSMRNRAVYLPERHPDQGEYLQDGTFVGKEQGTHRREILPAEIDPRQAATLNLTARENLDLTAWVDSARKHIQSMNFSATIQLKRESALDNKWRLYLLLPSAVKNREDALMKSTWVNADLTVQWADPAVFSRVELVWNTRFDRRFEKGFEEFGDKALRFQFRLPVTGGLEWDPTAVLNQRLRRDLSGGSRRVNSFAVDNRLIASVNSDWRATVNLEAARFRVAGIEDSYSRLSSSLGVTRFLGRSGRIESGVGINRLWGPAGEDILLVDMLGSARAGTSLNATAAVSVEPGERMLLHVRYTGRTDYLLDRFTHFGRAEMKYFF